MTMLICDIPTRTFGRIVKDLLADGWRKTDEYKNFDAWIDYGMLVLCKHEMSLKFVWDNWTEGTIQGPDTLVQELKEKYGLKT